MKFKKMIIVAAGCLFMTSCMKTYQCKDASGNITGEVKALNQGKAKSRCSGGASASLK